MASDLLERYELPFAWDASHRRLLIGAMDVSPTFREDGVQAEVGWPLFEMSLQSSSAPVILRGIVRPGTNGDRAWCRVVEFAEEFGISIGFDPLRLGERRGGLGLFWRSELREPCCRGRRCGCEPLIPQG